MFRIAWKVYKTGHGDFCFTFEQASESVKFYNNAYADTVAHWIEDESIEVD
jgi:hypothetical protein